MILIWCYYLNSNFTCQILPCRWWQRKGFSENGWCQNCSDSESSNHVLVKILGCQNRVEELGGDQKYHVEVTLPDFFPTGCKINKKTQDVWRSLQKKSIRPVLNLVFGDCKYLIQYSIRSHSITVRASAL